MTHSSQEGVISKSKTTKSGKRKALTKPKYENGKRIIYVYVARKYVLKEEK